MDHWAELEVTASQAYEIRNVIRGKSGVVPALFADFGDGIIVHLHFGPSDLGRGAMLSASLYDEDLGETVARLYPWEGADFTGTYEFSGVGNDRYDTYSLNVSVEGEDESDTLYTTEDCDCVIDEMYGATHSGKIEFEQYWYE